MAGPPPPSRRSWRAIEDHQGQLESWLRKFDTSGALPQARAAMDNAYAHGYAAGLEEAREEHLDATKTLLLNLLEAKFAHVDERALDKIEEAGLPRIQRWILGILESQSVQDVLMR